MNKKETPTKVYVQGLDGKFYKKCPYEEGLCRLCGTEGGKTKVVTTINQQKGLPQKILSITGIKIEPRDIISKKVCGKCLSLVNKVSAFKEECKNVQTKLLSRVKTKRMHSSPISSTQEKEKVTSSRKKLSYPGTIPNPTIPQTVLISETQIRPSHVSKPPVATAPTIEVQGPTPLPQFPSPLATIPRSSQLLGVYQLQLKQLNLVCIFNNQMY